MEDSSLFSLFCLKNLTIWNQINQHRESCTIKLKWLLAVRLWPPAITAGSKMHRCKQCAVAAVKCIAASSGIKLQWNISLLAVDSSCSDCSLSTLQPTLQQSYIFTWILFVIYLYRINNNLVDIDPNIYLLAMTDGPEARHVSTNRG